MRTENLKPRHAGLRQTSKSLGAEFAKLPVQTESRGSRQGKQIGRRGATTSGTNLDFDEIQLSRIQETQVRNIVVAINGLGNAL